MGKRHKDVVWELSDLARDRSDPQKAFRHNDTGVLIALLMDIRDELKQLNATFGCRNFTKLPAVVRAIERNTKKEKKV